MTEENVVKFLRCPASSVVELAITMANLTWKENLAITFCGRQAKTQEVAAEECDKSVDAIQKWYRAGIKKLCVAWNGIWWIKKLIE